MLSKSESKKIPVPLGDSKKVTQSYAEELALGRPPSRRIWANNIRRCVIRLATGPATAGQHWSSIGNYYGRCHDSHDNTRIPNVQHHLLLLCLWYFYTIARNKIILPDIVPM